MKSKLKGHHKRITGLAFSTNLGILVSSGADAQVSFYLSFYTSLLFFRICENVVFAYCCIVHVLCCEVVVDKLSSCLTN